MYAKKSKCAFVQEKIEYLGHIVSGKGVEMDSAKVEDMLNWSSPQNIKALRGFLRLTGYYRRFIKGYGQLAKPLTELLKKDAFHWDITAEQAFQNLKGKMSSSPVLRLPDFSKTFVVETDACGGGFGSCSDAR